MQKILMVSLGGIFGALLRYLLTANSHHLFGKGFPTGTLLVNLIGCFLIGIFLFLAEQKSFMNSELSLLLVTGFCGAFTTFSAFIYDAHSLVTASQYLKAFFYLIGSIAFGFMAFLAGHFISKFFLTILRGA